MSQILTVMSPSSPGKTSLTINLGLCYANLFPDKRVLVVDFSFSKPDIALFLDLIDSGKDEYPRSLDDLYPLLTGFQTVLLDDFITKPFEEITNFSIIPGFIKRTNSDERLSRDQWAYFFSVLDQYADVVIFDTDRNIKHLGFQYLMGETDYFLIATEADPILTVNLKHMINYLTFKGRGEHIRLLLLRSQPEHPYGSEHISQAINRSIDFVIPNILRRDYEKQVFNALPIGLSSKHHYTMAINKMVKSLCEDSVSVEQKRRTKWNIRIPLFSKKSQNI